MKEWSRKKEKNAKSKHYKINLKNRKVLKIKRKQLPPKMGVVEIEHKN